MKFNTRIRRLLPAVLTGLLVLPDYAAAYGGPGSIVSGIGALLAAVAAIGAAIFGFLWFPIKRLSKKLKGEESVGAAGAPELEESLSEK